MKRYHVVLGAALLMGVVSQSLGAFADMPVEITVSTHLAKEIKLKPTIFSVGFLRDQGFTAVEVAIRNMSQEAIVINPQIFSDISCLSKDVVTDLVWKLPRRVNTLLAVAGVSGLVALATLYGLHYYWNFVENSKAELTISLGARIAWGGLAGIAAFIPLLNTHIEHRLWKKACEHCLFDTITLQPGQEVKKFVFLDAKVKLPRTITCRISDASGMHHLVTASKQ